MDKVELLSPAGSWDSLKAAVLEGADAVYFGVGIFNARRRAENFKESELGNVICYCHDRGVRAYLAANTLVKNNEIGDYFRLIEKAYSAGIDAVIIQELSFLHLLKKSFPDLGVHISTQAGVFNSFYSGLLHGADMIILPREFTLKQVREFCDKTGLPVEVFVQGALCFSVSGQCLMSSFLGGRSGNRGLCAQPCRKKYNGRYLLSTRDLCLLEKLPEVVGAGESSLKIEGRLRTPEYAGAATAVYRRALDSLEDGDFAVDEDALLDMELAFNREYTLGGMFKEYDISTPEACGKRGVRLGVLGKGGLVRLEAKVLVGDGVGVFKGGKSHGDIVRRIQVAGCDVKVGVRGQTVRLFLNAKEGDEIVLTSGAARRRPYKLAARKSIVVDRKPAKALLPSLHPAAFSKEKLLVKTHSLSDARSAVEAGAGRVFYSVFARDYPAGDEGISPYVPRCLSEWNAFKAAEVVERLMPSSILCGDLGVATQLKDSEIYLDISCNAFNDLDVGYFNGLGMVPVISPELSAGELAAFKDKRFAVYAHGRIPLMTTRYKVGGDKFRDEKGYLFPLRTELECAQVLNSVPLGFFDEILKLKAGGINHFLLDLEDEVGKTIATYKRILAGEKIKKPRDYTLGHYKKGVC